ncbi:MAG: pilus assembly protein TadG-related protein, partial [Alteraurantiacibacter sp.]
GATGLTVDVSRGYQQKVSNQRAADLAALAAATAYNVNTASSVLQPTAADVVLANGIGGATVTATLVSNYPVTGSTSVKVTVTRAVPFYLSSVVGLSGSYNVNAAAYAQLGSSTTTSAPCYLALSTGSSAITVSGGATITASTCSVAAVGGIHQGGTGISAKDVIAGGGAVVLDYGSLSVTGNLYYGTNFTFPNWNTAVPAAANRKHQATSLVDPWAGNTDRTSAVALIGTYTAVPALTAPTTSGGGAWTLASGSASTPGATTTYNSGTKTFTVTAASPCNYNITSISISGDVKLAFPNGCNITIHNGVNSSGSTSINFGNSNVYINGNVTSSSSGMTFGDGVLWIGSGTHTFTGPNTKGAGDVTMAGNVTVGGGSSFSFGAGAHRFGSLTIGGGTNVKMGAGAFQASTGVSISGDSILALGAGDVLLGKNTSTNNAIYLSGSARFLMGDGTFSANGNINTSGGSRIIFGATTNHLINGNMTIAGSALFGAGRYTINGNFVNGTGGTTWPYTSAYTGLTYGSASGFSGYDMAGTDVTFVLSGSLNLGGGALTHLEAPATTTSGGGIAELLFTSQTTSATTWGAGSSNKFGGAVHIPNSALTMSGGNGTVGGTSCFSLIASTITISGGAQTASACTAMSGAFSGGGGSGTVRLVN